MFSKLLNNQSSIVKNLRNAYISFNEGSKRIINLQVRHFYQQSTKEKNYITNKFQSHLPIHWKKYMAASSLVLLLSAANNSEGIISAEEGKTEIKKGKNQPIVKNLVFQGGGPKGTAYVGALLRLEEELGGLETIERVGGASAGAIMATLLAVGYTPEEIEKKLLREQPALFKTFLEDGTELDRLNAKLANAFTHRSTVMKGLSGLGSVARHPVLSYRLLKRFQTERSFCSGEAFREWMDDIIASKLAELKGKNKEEYQWLTFGELKALIDEEGLQENITRHYRELYVVGALLKPGEKGMLRPVFSTENAEMENYIISDAVRISMSIPLVFGPHSIYIKDAEKQRRELETSHQQGVDGGLLDNYPIALFNQNRYLSLPFAKQAPGEQYSNFETLGFKLYDKSVTDPMWRWLARLWNVYQEPSWQENMDLPQHIKVDIRGVSLFDFDMPPEKINALIESGKSHVKNYFLSDLKKLKEYQEREIARREQENNNLLQKYKRFTNLQDNFPLHYYQVPENYKELEPYIKNFSKADKKTLTQLGIVGISGSGKSEMARYSAQQYLNFHFWHYWKKNDKGFLDKNGPVIWFIKAESEGTLLESFKELAKKLDFPADSAALSSYGDTFKQKIDGLYNDIQSRLELQFPHYLFIFDNVDDLNLIRNYLRNDKKGTVIITTQDLNEGKNIDYDKVIDLSNGLSFNKAKGLIQTLHPNLENDKNLGQLVCKLEHLPLALAVAACYIKENKLSCEEYIGQWDAEYSNLEREQSFIAKNRRDLARKPRTQEATICLSIEKLKQHKIPYALLEICSHLNADNIPKSLLSNWLSQSTKRVIDKALLESVEIAIKQLQKYSLIYDRVDDTLSMHRLTQKSMLHYNKESFTSEWYGYLFNSIHDILKKDVIVEHDYYHKQILIPHLEAVFTNVALPKEKYTPEIIQGYIDLGLLYKAMGDANKAVRHYEEILPLVDNRKDELGNLAADFYIRLGRAYQGGPGQFIKAKECYEKARQIYARDNKSSAVLAEILNDLGMACRDIGHDTKNGLYNSQKINPHFEEAYDHLKQAVDMADQLSTQKKNGIRYRTNLGEVYRLLQNFDDAEKIILEAISIGKVEFGEEEEDRLMASAYFNLGKVYMSRGKSSLGDETQAKIYYNRAKNHFEKAINIGKNIYGERHPLVARHTDALGEAWRKLGDETEACKNFQEAFKILQFSKGAQAQLKDKINNHVDSCQDNSMKFKRNN